METGLRLREAQQVHASILTNGRMIGQALVDMACLLKRMRDERLYEELGRESFEEYVREDVGLGVRQAYNYIQTYERLQPELLARYSGAGITKLQLLCEISAPEREEFAEEADIANITVSELERLVQEKNGLHEQLSFLQAEAKTDAAVKLETEEKLRKLEREIEQLRSEPVPVQVKEIVKEDPEAQERIKELEQQVQEEDLRAARRVEEEREAAKKAVREAKAEKAEAVKKAMEKAAEEARAAALKEAEEKAEAEKKERAAEQEAMLAEMEMLRKKAAAGEAMASKELAEFAVLLKKVQQDVKRMREIAEGMEDAAQREKLEKALDALRGVI